VYYTFSMVILKSSKAEGSFLGFGTHVWLVVSLENGEKITFSGSKQNKRLAVIKNYKRDYDKVAARGQAEVPPPPNMSQKEWDEAVIQAGDNALDEFHLKLEFSGFFPCGESRGNCGTAAKYIIEYAGGSVPSYKAFLGFTPGLLTEC